MISISRVSDINFQSNHSEGNLNLLDAIMDTQTLNGSENDSNLTTSNGNVIGRGSPIILNSNVVLVNAGRKVRVIAQCVKFKDGKKVGLNNCVDNHDNLL